MTRDSAANEIDGVATTVLVADRHPAIREALVHRLAGQADFKVVAECGTFAELVDAAMAKRPGIAVTEVIFPDGNGLDFLGRMREQGAAVRTLVWSTIEPHIYSKRIERAGAWGYLTKDASTLDVVAAMRRIRDGERCMPAVLDGETPDDSENPLDAIHTFSNRELEVFQWLGEGRDMHDIATQLGVSVKTVETYRARIKQKLGIRNRMNLLRCAVEWSIEQRRMPNSLPDHDGTA